MVTIDTHTSIYNCHKSKQQSGDILQYKGITQATYEKLASKDAHRTTYCIPVDLLKKICTECSVTRKCLVDIVIQIST